MSKEKLKKYPHADHRQRVRKAFREAGADGMPDRGLLELLLFYSIPRRDTNSIAAELLEKYGSIKGVFDAPYDELLKTDGMGESSALLLTMLPEITRRYNGTGKDVPLLFENNEAEKYIQSLFSESKVEEFYIVCLNAVGGAVMCRCLAKGGKDHVSVDKRAILEAAFEADADSVILAHNHPDGEAAPSADDITLTKDTARLLAETGIGLTDHIIVGKDSVLSLASTEKFRDIFSR